MPANCDREAFVDACLTGIGVYIPAAHGSWGLPVSIYCNLSCFNAQEIFLNKMMAILCALVWFAMHPDHCGFAQPRLLIHSDNMSLVDTWNLLRTKHKFVNCLLLRSIQVVLNSAFVPRVIHIAGEQNVMADLLSRGMFADALLRCPGMQLMEMSPPQV